LLFSFDVFAVIPLLLAAVFRCYLVGEGFKTPEFLGPGEVPLLYFPGIISGISEHGHPRSRRRAIGCASLRCLALSERTDGHHWSRRCPVSWSSIMNKLMKSR
jgi:hypothetical protein